MDWIELAKWGGGILAAAIAGGFVFKRVTTRRSANSVRIVSQKNNTAGGDIVAGNSIKKSDN